MSRKTKILKPHKRPRSPFHGPPSFEEITVDLTRFDGGTGSCLVEGGVPLKPGLLQIDEADLVSLWISSVEQTVYTEILKGTHPDGSARAVFIQSTQIVDDGSPVAAIVKIGTTQTQTTSKTVNHRKIRFTSGGTDKIEIDDILEGATSGATAAVKRLALKFNNSTHWTGGSNAGWLYLSGQSGTFEAENLNLQGGQANICTIAGNSVECVTLVGREAVIIPTSADYLVQWESLGPLIPEANYPAGDAQDWEDDFETAMDILYADTPWTWGSTGDTFYDRTWNHLQKWSVSGIGSWFTRALEYADWVHDEADFAYQQIFYQEPMSKFQTYWLTGAEEFPDSVVMMAERNPGSYITAQDVIDDEPHVDADDLGNGRPMQKFTAQTLIAWLYGDTFINWTAEVPKWIEANEVHQGTDGSFEHAWDHDLPTNLQLNYQGGMRIHALLLMYDWASALLTSQQKTDIENLIVGWVDFMFEDGTRPQWDGTELAMYYGAGPYEPGHTYGYADIVPLADCPPLNGLIIDAVAFAYQVTSTAKYKTNAESMLQGLVDKVTPTEWTWFSKTANQISFGVRNAIARIDT